MREIKIEPIAGVRNVVLYYFAAKPFPGTADESIDWYECRMAFHDDVPDHEAFIREFLARYKKTLAVLRSKKVGPIDEVLGHASWREMVDTDGVAYLTLRDVKKGEPPVMRFDGLLPFPRKQGN